MQGFPDNQSPTLSSPVNMFTEQLEFPDHTFYDPYSVSGTGIFQPAGDIIDARDERMRQVSYSGGLLWTSEFLHEAEGQLCMC